MRVAVIGSGLAGLSAACTLASRGYSVEVFEKNPWFGGKAALLQESGFRFDMGPTILIKPSVLAKIFHEAGRDMSDYLSLVRLDPQWRCFFEDGSRLDLLDDPQQMAYSLEAIWPKMGKGYLSFLEQSKQLESISEKFFFWRSIGSMRDTFDAKGAFDIKVLRDVLRMRLGKTVSEVIREAIPDANVAQMLDHFVQYVGSSPDASPAILCAIGQMQMEEGISYPMGGTRAVPEALLKLALELGVVLHNNVDVERILAKTSQVSGPGRVTGLRTTDGAVYDFDAVISNEDAVRTHRELLTAPLAKSFGNERNYEPACSGVVLYLGLDRKYEHLAHHNFVFSKDPKEEFDAIYKHGIPAPDPTCYLAATSTSDPTSAPEGGEALYVLVHTPYIRPGQDWKTMYPPYRQVILDKLKRTAGLTDIEDRIVFEHHLTPQDIHERYRVLNGAIYGLSSHGVLNGAFKPANRSKLLPGMYLAGGAAHPGPGMPMVLMSGWIAADSLDEDVKNGKLAPHMKSTAA